MVSKKCSKCGETKLLEGFTVDRRNGDGRGACCKKCRNITVEAWRQKNPEAGKARMKKWRKGEAGIKEAARRAERVDLTKLHARKNLLYAVKTGKVVRPSCCERCGTKSELHGHHADYQKQLDAEWLCHRCHAQEHLQDV